MASSRSPTFSEEVQRLPSHAVDSAAAQLYALPLDRFTAARDELARQLRQVGQRKEAEEVRALRKPTAAAWGLNQLAHRRRHDVEELLVVGTRLREAQEQLLRGGDREPLDAASKRLRELTDRLTEDATTIATEGGVAATTTLVERIRSTLHAALVDDEAARELLGGRLVRDRQAVGFPDLAGVPSSRPKSVAKKPDRRGAEVDDRKRAEELRRRLDQARTEHRDAQRRLELAQRGLQRARVRAEEAVQRLRQAETEEQELRTAAEAAERQAGKLAAELQRLAT